MRRLILPSWEYAVQYLTMSWRLSIVFLNRSLRFHRQHLPVSWRGLISFLGPPSSNLQIPLKNLIAYDLLFPFLSLLDSLLGVQYGPAVDMWSLGCILGELLHENPILPGSKDEEQLDLIYSLCGTPTKETWPDRIEVSLTLGACFRNP